MGWTETIERFKTLKQVREYFKADIAPYTFVVDKMDLGVWYCAATNPKTNLTICFVYKYTWEKTGKLCYKDMDETVGPCEYKPSKKILQALSPTEHPYAIEWRKKCWEQFKKV